MDLALPNRLTPVKQKAEESPAANDPKKLKVDVTPEVMNDDLPFDVYSTPGDRIELTPADLIELTPEDIAAMANRPNRFKEVREEEHVVVLLQNAFAEFSFKEYVPDNDPDDTPYPDPDDEKNYQLLIKEYVESEGFDVEHFCDKAAFLLSLDLDGDPTEDIVLCDCKPSVEAAIKRVNKEKHSNLVLEKIIKCNYIHGANYFATIDVIDKDTGVSSTYQVQVYRDHFTGRTTVHKFRPKPNYPKTEA